MDNEKKLFSSIGRLDDDILDSALGFENKNDKNKGGVFSFKKFTVIALAAAMCIGLVITVSAYGDAIWAAIAQRQRELIDDKSQHINNSVKADSGITLTVDNVASCVGDGYFYFTVHSGREPFTNGLKYDEFEIYYLTDPDLNITYSDYNKPEKMGDWHLMFADNEDKSGWGGVFSTIEKVDYDPEKPTTAVKFFLKTTILNTKYKIIMRGITSEDVSIEYADELEIEFKVDQKEMKSVNQLRFFTPSPEVEFELDGNKYQILSMNMEPYNFSIKLISRDEGVIEYDGTEYYNVTRFNPEQWMTKGWFDCKEQELQFYWTHPEISSIEGASEETMAEYNELREKSSALLQESLIVSYTEPDSTGGYHAVALDDGAYSQSYDIFVELKPDCGASVVRDLNTNYYQFGIEIIDEDTLDMTMCAGKSFKFSSPIYINDIKRVYITKPSDPDFELTIYEPDKDESLKEYLGSQG